MGMKQRLKTLNNGKLTDSEIEERYQKWIDILYQKFSKLDATWQGTVPLSEAVKNREVRELYDSLYVNLEWNEEGQTFQHFVLTALLNEDPSSEQVDFDDLFALLKKIHHSNADFHKKFAVAIVAIVDDQQFQRIQTRLLQYLISRIDQNDRTKAATFLRGKELFLALFHEKYRRSPETTSFINRLVASSIKEIRTTIEKHEGKITQGETDALESDKPITKVDPLKEDAKNSIEKSFNFLWLTLMCNYLYKDQLLAFKNKQEESFLQLKEIQKEEMEKLTNDLNANPQYQSAREQMQSDIKKIEDSRDNVVERKKTRMAEWKNAPLKVAYDRAVSALQQKQERELQEWRKSWDADTEPYKQFFKEHAVFPNNLPSLDVIEIVSIPSIVEDTCALIVSELTKELENNASQDNNNATDKKIITQNWILIQGLSLFVLRFLGDLFVFYPSFASSSLKEKNLDLFNQYNGLIQNICLNVYNDVMQRSVARLSGGDHKEKDRITWKNIFVEDTTKLVLARMHEATHQPELIAFLEGIVHNAQQRPALASKTENLTQFKKNCELLAQELVRHHLTLDAVDQQKDQQTADKEKRLFKFIGQGREDFIVSELNNARNYAQAGYSGTLYLIDFSITNDNGDDLIVAAIKANLNIDIIRLMMFLNPSFQQNTPRYIEAAFNAKYVEVFEIFKMFKINFDLKYNLNNQLQLPLFFAIEKFIQSDFEDKKWCEIIYTLITNNSDHKTPKSFANPNQALTTDDSTMTIAHLIAVKITQGNWERVKPFWEALVAKGMLPNAYNDSFETAFYLFVKNCPAIHDKTSKAEKDFIEDVCIHFVKTGVNPCSGGLLDTTPINLLKEKGYGSLADKLFKMFNAPKGSDNADLKRSSSGEEPHADNNNAKRSSGASAQGRDDHFEEISLTDAKEGADKKEKKSKLDTFKSKTMTLGGLIKKSSSSSLPTPSSSNPPSPGMAKSGSGG